MSNQIQATVKYAAGAPKDTARGLRINAVVILADGREDRIWDSPGGIVSTWQKGQTVTLEQKGQYLNPVAGATPAAPTAPANAAPQAQAPAQLAKNILDPEYEAELHAKAISMIGIYRAIYVQLGEDPILPFESVPAVAQEDRAAATATIFIQLMRNG
jgi:hypothetical protein